MSAQDYERQQAIENIRKYTESPEEKADRLVAETDLMLSTLADIRALPETQEKVR